jgi:hypothetical protein
LLDLRVGERLGYGMALALVIVAQQIVTVDMIPISNHGLWIDRFIGWSFYWVIFGLVESVFVGYCYFLRQRDEDIDGVVKDANHVVKDNDASSSSNNDDAKQQPLPSMAGSESGSASQMPEEDAPLKKSSRHSSDSALLAIPHPRWRVSFLHTIPLRGLDHFFFFFCLITYTAFVLAMFLTIPKWGSNIPEPWD